MFVIDRLSRSAFGKSEVRSATSKVVEEKSENRSEREKRCFQEISNVK